MVSNIKKTTNIKNFSFHFPADKHDASKPTSLDGVINPTSIPSHSRSLTVYERSVYDHKLTSNGSLDHKIVPYPHKTISHY